jgi:pentatricopeptide repeat protein
VLQFFHWCSPVLPSPLPSSLALLAKSFSCASSTPSPSLLAPLPSQLLGPSLLSPILCCLPPPRILPFALALFPSRPDHDHPVLFLSLLEALSKAGHVAAAEQLIEELQPWLPLSLRHYTVLLYGWRHLGKHVLARMKATEVAPDVVAFNTLLVGFVTDGRFEDTFELVREMERRGCLPNAVSYI